MGHSGTETVDIENAGGVVSLRHPGNAYYDISIDGDGVAEYVIEERARGKDSWRRADGRDFTGSSDYDITASSDRLWVRVRCTSGTGSADDQATIRISAGGEVMAEEPAGY